MIRISKKRITTGISVAFQTGTLDDLDEDKQFDILVCPFFLDLFEGNMLCQTVDQLDRYLRAGGRVLYADFQPATGLKGIWSRFLIRLMYTFFRLFAGIQANRLENPWPYFEEKGYTGFAIRENGNSMFRSEVFVKGKPE
ncbi:MAG: class I SAM-dependent methyltransferase [Bacteroidia bacterium]